MVDEVQTGMGRLGTMFGYQRFEGVDPDVMTLGKAGRRRRAAGCVRVQGPLFGTGTR